MYLIRRRGRWLAGAALAAAAAGSTFAFLPTASGAQSAIGSIIASDSNQTSVVEAAFTSAIEADREAQAPSASAYGNAANAAASAGRVAPVASAALRNKQLQDGKSALARYFAPGQAKHEEIGLTNAVNAEADPKFRNLGSGVKKVKFDSVAVSGDTATLRAEVTAWAKFQQQESNGNWATANPVNVMIYNVTMTRNSSGQWMVSSMVGDFAPGEAP
jgi:hypothetical protein